MIALSAVIFAVLAAIVAGDHFYVLPNPGTRDEAIAACANAGLQLAALTVDSIEAVSAKLPANASGWIASWNGDDYQGACLRLKSLTITDVASCDEKNLPICSSWSCDDSSPSYYCSTDFSYDTCSSSLCDSISNECDPCCAGVRMLTYQAPFGAGAYLAKVTQKFTVFDVFGANACSSVLSLASTLGVGVTLVDSNGHDVCFSAAGISFTALNNAVSAGSGTTLASEIEALGQFTTLSDAQFNVDNAQTDLNSAQTTFINSETAFTTDQTSLTTALADISGPQTTYASDLAALTTAQDSLTVAQTALQANPSNVSLQASVEANQGNVQTAQTAVNNSEPPFSNAQNNLTEAQTAFDNALSAYNSDLLALTNAQTALETAQAALTNAQAELAADPNNSTLVAEIVAAQGAVNDAQANFDGALLTFNTAQDTFDTAQDAFNSAQDTFTTDLDALTSAQAALTSAQNALASSPGSATLLADVTAAQNTVNAAQSTFNTSNTNFLAAQTTFTTDITTFGTALTTFTPSATALTNALTELTADQTALTATEPGTQSGYFSAVADQALIVQGLAINMINTSSNPTMKAEAQTVLELNNQILSQAQTAAESTTLDPPAALSVYDNINDIFQVNNPNLLDSMTTLGLAVAGAADIPYGTFYVVSRSWALNQPIYALLGGTVSAANSIFNCAGEYRTIYLTKPLSDLSFVDNGNFCFDQCNEKPQSCLALYNGLQRPGYLPKFKIGA